MPKAPVKFQKLPKATQHCRHYSYNVQNVLGGASGPCCAKGLDLSAPGAAMPCMPKSVAPRPLNRICAQREEYTATERDTWNKWKTESMGRMILVLAAIP